jgi:DnaJ family protein C protein 13
LTLQNLLIGNPTLASIFSSKEQLIPLFECLIDTNSSGEVPELCLNILSILTTHAPSVEAMVADLSSLMHVLRLLHSAPACRPGALRVLSALASTSELAWVTAKHGGFVYILQLLLPMQSMFLFFLPFMSLYVNSTFSKFINSFLNVL